MDADEVLTSALVIEAMSSASADGWRALESAQDSLRTTWSGTRSAEFADRTEQLLERARNLLARMDQVAPGLRAAIDGYVETDTTNAVALRNSSIGRE